MKSAAEQLLKQAKKLPPMERAELLERIIESFDAEPDNEIKSAWADEAERRLSMHVRDSSDSMSEQEVYDIME